MEEKFTVKIEANRQAILPPKLLDWLQLRVGDQLEIKATKTEVRSVAVRRLSWFTPEIVTLLNERQERIDAGECDEYTTPVRLAKRKKANV